MGLIVKYTSNTQIKSRTQKKIQFDEYLQSFFIQNIDHKQLILCKQQIIKLSNQRQMQKPQTSLQKSRTIGNYIITKNLGQGTFGKVKLGIHIVSQQKVAIKILQKSKIIDVADVQRVTREIHILKQIRHPNLIQLYQIIQTPKQLFLVMQYVTQGELFEHIVKKKKLKQNQACQFFRQLIQGVQYMHQLGVVHRDLKPQNLLIDFNKRLKIVDFGLSNTYKNKEMLKTACGSPCYAAPEMIAGKKYHGLNADIWSCGVILFAMICGYLPFQDPNTSNLYKKITAGDFSIPKFVSPFAKQLLQRILTTDPDRRIKMSDIKRHAWYRQPLQSSFPPSIGIKVGYHTIPIDQSIISQVVSTCPQNGYEQTRKFVAGNRHNHTTTIYYLLLKRNLRNTINSRYDICSNFFDYDLLKVQGQQQHEEQQANAKPAQDIQQIKLDRLTTATGIRTFRAFKRTQRNISVNQSPDITAHNFYVNKQKSKPKQESNELSSQFQGSSQLSTIQDSLLLQGPSSQRRKIYFQAPAKSIISSIQNPRKQNPIQFSLYNIDDKRQTLNGFYHQDRRTTGTTQGNRQRQNISFRTSLNNSKIYRDKPVTRAKEDTFVSRELQTRAQGNRETNKTKHDRYMSLDVTSKDRNNDPEQHTYNKNIQKKTIYTSRNSSSHRQNPKELMNRTFMQKIPLVSGLKMDKMQRMDKMQKIDKIQRMDKTQNESQRVKQIFNSTIAGGFSLSNRRKISTRSRDMRQTLRLFP